MSFVYNYNSVRLKFHFIADATSLAAGEGTSRYVYTHLDCS